MYFKLLIWRFQTSPCVCFQVPLPTSQFRYKKQVLSDNDVPTFCKPQYNGHIMFFLLWLWHQLSTWFREILISSLQNLVGSQPQAYIHLSWPIYMIHCAVSYAIFLIRCPVLKQNHCNWIFIFKYSVISTYIIVTSEYHHSQWKRFSSEVGSWYLTHVQTKILSNRKICTIALYVS